MHPRNRGMGMILAMTTLVLLWAGAATCLAHAEEGIPTAEEVASLLQREPIQLESWPAWRARLLAWMGDRSKATDAAYEAARKFAKSQELAVGQLGGKLAEDHLGWYTLAGYYLDEARDRVSRQPMAKLAEAALRQSIKLDARFARAHRNLALAIFLQDDRQAGAEASKARRDQAEQALAEARRLEPTLHLAWIEGLGAIFQARMADAERHFRQACNEEPERPELAGYLARAITFNPSRQGKRAPDVKKLTERFPADGDLVCLHAVALATDDEITAAYQELERARAMGANPTDVLGSEIVQLIEEHGKPGLLARFGWVMLYFAVIYVVVMVVMALAGLVLAGRTRGTRALELLGTAPGELVTEGQVSRTASESLLARVYALALMLGLILFYVAIPFLIASALAGTCLLLYWLFHAPRIPIKLVIIIVVIGLGAAWAIAKSVFASASKGSFGLPKSPEECPRLHQVVREVAERVNTRAVDRVFIAPNSAISVHQEGRGPFGMFGVKERVLTLGVSALNFITVGELKSILAHEYAHFSHSDTFYSRFIYRVDLSISTALQGIAASGGWVTYVNPLFWFLYWYYKAYSLLSAGYSRSREFLADRMAGVLYGSDVFAGALTKVCTDAALFEGSIYQNISGLLAEGKAFENMYAAFRDFRNEQLTHEEREGLYSKLLDEQGSVFASHPTFGERVAAIADLPKAHANDTTPAMQLFENPEEMEKEMTDFLTAYMHHLQPIQAQAAQAG